MRTYRATLTYSGLLAAGSAALATRNPATRASWLLWGSTNLENLQHRPLVVLVVSAFLPEDHPVLWVALAVIGLGAAESALGPARTAALVAAGHLLGTAVSEGLLGYRVHIGELPVQARQIVDVGPSFVVVTALVAAVVVGRRRARVLAGITVAVLAPGLLDGITELDVAAVGHICAMAVGAAGAWAVRRTAPQGSRSPR